MGSCSNGQEYGNRNTYTEECCQLAGDYQLVCKDSYGDGWHGGYIEILGVKYCQGFLDGDLDTGGPVAITYTTGPVVYGTPILQNLYAQLGQPVPWNYWQIRDSRTLFNMLPKDPRKDVQMDLHNALADCYFQAKSVQKAYKNFGVKKR